MMNDFIIIYQQTPKNMDIWTYEIFEFSIIFKCHGSHLLNVSTYFLEAILMSLFLSDPFRGNKEHFLNIWVFMELLQISYSMLYNI